MTLPWPEGALIDRQSEGEVSHFVAMQRVVVRMLFDPAFTNQVYDNPDQALAGLNLDKDLVAQLRSNDRRLWQADRLRRRRALKVLMEEFRISSALALLACGKLATLDAFFSSKHFHNAVQQRRYMALAFRDYLTALLDEGALKSPGLKAVLTLEGQLALSRRELREFLRGRDPRPAFPKSTEPLFRTRPGVLTVTLPEGTLSLISQIEEYLFEASLIPALALCDDAPRPENLASLSDQQESFLIEPDDTQKVDFNKVEHRYASLIKACRQPQSQRQLRRSLRGEGVSKSQLKGMLEALVGAGVLESA